MNFSLSWLPDVLRAKGLEVLEVKGWETRGHGDMEKVQGILCHHTCGPLKGDMGALDVIVKGRPDLGGPLCNLGLGRSGKFYMVASGKGWHAGRGNWQGVTDGNAHLIGIEAENTGETRGPRAETWPDVQMRAYVRGCAAILEHIEAKSIMCAGHKEYALPRGRKDDPNFDMNKFREDVAAAIGDKPVQPTDLKSGTINVDDLNVRSSASATSIVVDVLPKGAPITIESESVNGSTKWYKIEIGYVAARYVTLK